MVSGSLQILMTLATVLDVNAGLYLSSVTCLKNPSLLHRDKSYKAGIMKQSVPVSVLSDTCDLVEQRSTMKRKNGKGYR